MSFTTMLQTWENAKKNFQEGAGKKRPGDPVKAGKLAKFVEKFKAHTGITPLAKAFDKAAEAAVQTELQKADTKKRQKLVADLVKAGDDLKDQCKKYIEILKGEIEKELKDGDTYGDVKRCLENLSNEVEVLISFSKTKIKNAQGQAKAFDDGQAALAPYLGMLLQVNAGMTKAVAGMKILVRNIRALPTLDNYMKNISGDPATRWATTQYKSMGVLCVKLPGFRDKLGFDPKLLENQLNDYGAGWDEEWWRKKIGGNDVTKSVLSYAADIEKGILLAEKAALKMKEIAKDYQ